MSLTDLSLETKISEYKLTVYEGGKYMVPAHYTLMCNALNIDPDFMGIGNKAFEISGKFKKIVPVIADMVYEKVIYFHEMNLFNLFLLTDSLDIARLQEGPEIRIIDRILNNELNARDTLYNLLCIVDCYLWQNYGPGLNKENKKYKIVYL